MFHHGSRLPSVFRHVVSLGIVCGFRVSASGLAALMIGIVLLAGPTTVVAQRHGGGGGGGAAGSGNNSRPIICLHDCPALREGLSAEDDLKDFRRSIAVQASDEQRAAFVEKRDADTSK